MKTTYLKIDPSKIYYVSSLTRLLGFQKTSDTVGSRLRCYNVPFYSEPVNGGLRSCYEGVDLIKFSEKHPCLLRIRNPRVSEETPDFSTKSSGFLSIMERTALIKRAVKSLPVKEATALIRTFSEELGEGLV